MRYLLDTNVVSEWVKRTPSPAVVAWLDYVAEDDVFMSVISFAELHRGVALLSPGRRRAGLQNWIEKDLMERFRGRVLQIDLAVAEAWGRITARASRKGRSLGVMDAFFAATADIYELALATRDVHAFEGLGIDLVNPWEAE